MTILFSPSESKRPGGSLPPLEPTSLIFPELYGKRLEVMERYERLLAEASGEELADMFGLKERSEFERYRTPFESAPTMKALLRYDGVAYGYLDYPSLPTQAQEYLERHLLIFSNLFGPIGAGLYN